MERAGQWKESFGSPPSFKIYLFSIRICTSPKLHSVLQFLHLQTTQQTVIRKKAGFFSKWKAQNLSQQRPFFATGFPFFSFRTQCFTSTFSTDGRMLASLSTYNVDCFAFKFAGHSVHALLTYICLLALAQGQKGSSISCHESSIKNDI